MRLSDTEYVTYSPFDLILIYNVYLDEKKL